MQHKTQLCLELCGIIAYNTTLDYSVKRLSFAQKCNTLDDKVSEISEPLIIRWTSLKHETPDGSRSASYTSLETLVNTCI